MIAVASSTQNAAVIEPPAGGVTQNASDLISGNPIAAQLLVTHGNFTIRNMTVDGSGNGITGCAPDLQGILIQNASGTLDHVTVRNQIPGGILGGCLTGGEGVFVQSSGGTSAVTIKASSVHNYNTNGITGNETGTTLTASGNFVEGSGLVPGGPVQNGIQLGFGAKGTITVNTINGNISGSSPPAAADILLYDTAESAGIMVTNNVLGDSQLPIALETLGDNGPNLGDGVTVTGNKISNAPGDAIDVCTNQNTITSNTIYNSTGSAVHFDASCGIAFGGFTGMNNSATKNTMVDSGCAGILDDTGGTGSNVISPNTFVSVPFPISYSTASCPFVSAPVSQSQNKDRHKVRPRR